MRLPRTNRLFGLSLLLAGFLPISARSEELPIVDVEFQPFAAQVRRVVEALDGAGEPLPREVKDQIDLAIKMPDGSAAVRTLQKILDARCLVGIDINPESRVRAVQGSASPRLVQHGWRVFLVKVRNEAGVTAELVAGSPNASPLYKRSNGSAEPAASIPASEVPMRWMDLALVRDRPLTRRLSSLGVEYTILRIYSRDAGKREAKLTFDIGAGTQDLGARSEVDILFTCEPAVPVTLEIKDVDGRPTMASLLIRDAQGRVYPSQTRRLAPDFFFHPQVYRADGETVLLPAGEYTVE